MREHVVEAKDENRAVERWENEGGKSAGVFETNDESFEQDVLQAEHPVLVDFWAEWCPACRQFAPTVGAIATEYAGSLRVAKINVDDNPATPQRYHIKSIPTLILFKEGKEAGRIIGATSKESIAMLLEPHAGARA